MTYKNEKLKTLTDILKVNLDDKNSCSKTMIFCNSRKRCVSIASYVSLTFEKINVVLMHGNMSQEERDTYEDRFRSGKARIMICTDVICRGHDSGNVNLVIQFDLPFGSSSTDQDKYIHRIG